MSSHIDGRAVFESVPADRQRRLQQQVSDGWSDEEIIDFWRKVRTNFAKRGEHEVTAAAAYLRGHPAPEPKPADPHVLTQAAAIELHKLHGSYREAAKHSDWEASHIYRVATGERGKPSN